MPDNYEKYEGMIKELSRESGRMAWSSGNSTLFYMILLIIVTTIAACIFFPFANMLIMMFIFIAEGIALFIPLALYHHKAGVYMRDRCVELERAHPGIYDAYEEWRRRIAEKSPDGYSS
jgi:hypothetical protein